MTIFEDKNAKKILKLDGIEGFQRFLSDKLELINISIKSGKKIDKHKVPFDAFFYILSGKGEVIIDETTLQIKKNDIIECKAKTERTWINNSNTTLELLTIKLLK
jgi:quercetin dioxygenase-like cupin family protein